MKVIGIDLDSDVINLSIMDKNKDLISIKSLDISDIPKNDVKELYISNKDKFLITSALEASDVIIKDTDFSIKKSFFIKKAIKYLEESISTLDTDKTIISTVYLKKDSKLKFFITTKEMLNKHLCRLKHINIDPDRVTSVSQALIRFINFYYRDIESSFLIHLAKNKTTCILIKNHQPVKTFSIKIGTNKLIEADKTDRQLNNSQIDVLNINSKSKLKTDLTHLKKEIEKVFIYFCPSKEEKHPLIVTGDLNSFSNLSEFLKNDKVTTLLKSPILEKKLEYKKFAICIGLSLDALKKDSLSLQFRKDGYTPVKKFENVGKKTLFFTFVVLAFTFLIYFGSDYFLKNKESILEQRLSFMKEAENRYLGNKKKEIFTNFYADLNKFEKKLENENKLFPYILKVPNVSETLNWLNNHKHLKEAEITYINYSLENFPTFFTKTQAYVAKIEIEFKTKKPSIARSFYDSLSKSDGLVNPNQKTSWKAKDNTYRASFYLKNIK
ncbi:MAG: hypothetical protein K1060chlam1_00589 [Candidatus Anoxychlamydiales bacterium]|nr:hypothetical protein [Candidatus Anoxychlamydiales bacterium]